MEGFVGKNLNGRNRLEGGILLKWMLNEHDGRQCIQIVLVRIWINDGLLLAR